MLFRSGLGCPGSLGPAALLGVSGARNPFPTGSPSWGSRIGRAKPSAPRPQPCPLSQLGRSAPRPRRTDGPKQSSGSCILQRETLLGQQTTAPTRLGSRKQRKPFSPPAPPLHRANAGGLPKLPAPCCFAGCLRCPKPTPHGFSFVGITRLVAESSSSAKTVTISQAVASYEANFTDRKSVV